MIGFTSRISKIVRFLQDAASKTNLKPFALFCGLLLTVLISFFVHQSQRLLILKSL